MPILIAYARMLPRAGVAEASLPKSKLKIMPTNNGGPSIRKF